MHSEQDLVLTLWWSLPGMHAFCPGLLRSHFRQASSGYFVVSAGPGLCALAAFQWARLSGGSLLLPQLSDLSG